MLEFPQSVRLYGQRPPRHSRGRPSPCNDDPSLGPHAEIGASESEVPRKFVTPEVVTKARPCAC
jgi:hypothetical protein